MKSRGLRRSIADFRRHPWLHFLSISTITIALLILGLFFLCHRNFILISERADSYKMGTLYLRDNLLPQQVDGLKERILTFPSVRKVEYKSRQSVLDELQKFMGSQPSEFLSSQDFFPDLLEVELAKGLEAAGLGELKSELSALPEVLEADFSEGWLTQFKRIRKIMDGFGLFLMIAVVLGCGFIIANFMGIRHQARKHEMDVVQLMGARTQFILAPFLWEGILEGILGSLAALVVVYSITLVGSTLLSIHWASLLGIKSFAFLSVPQAMSLVGLGILMAVLGSVTVFLRFQSDQPR